MENPVLKIFYANKVTVTIDVRQHSLGEFCHRFTIKYYIKEVNWYQKLIILIFRRKLGNCMDYKLGPSFLVSRKFLLKFDHMLLEFIFNPCKELKKVTSSKILK